MHEYVGVRHWSQKVEWKRGEMLSWRVGVRELVRLYMKQVL